jgi:hypothetical protein
MRIVKSLFKRGRQMRMRWITVVTFVKSHMYEIIILARTFKSQAQFSMHIFTTHKFVMKNRSH